MLSVVCGGCLRCLCGLFASFACVVVWRVWFCDVVFGLCVARVRVVLI